MSFFKPEIRCWENDGEGLMQGHSEITPTSIQNICMKKTRCEFLLENPPK